MDIGLAIALVVVGALLVVVVLGAVALSRGWIHPLRRPEQRSTLVIGVGGGGSNAIDRMVDAQVPGVRFIACNTDAQALRRSRAPHKLRIGDAVTGGLGSGGDPEVGQRAAEEDEARILAAVGHADLVVLTAGLGGGTGSGAGPIVAAAAKDGGALTIAVVTRPFSFEGLQRERIAQAAGAQLAPNVDAMIVVPNDRISDVLPPETSFADAFRAVDDVLLRAVRGLTDLIGSPGLINVDFADVCSVLKNAGPTLIGVGQAGGPDRAVEAARQAAAGPLLEASIRGARRILFNIAGPPDLSVTEVRKAADEVRAHADPEANIIFGATLEPELGDEVVVTVIAAGLRAELPASGTEPKPSAVAAATAAETTTGRSTGDARTVRASAHVAAPRAAADRGRSRAPERRPAGATEAAPTDLADQDGPAERGDLDVPSFLRRA
jgi:cell division protein FtsZ